MAKAFQQISMDFGFDEPANPPSKEKEAVNPVRPSEFAQAPNAEPRQVEPLPVDPRSIDPMSAEPSRNEPSHIERSANETIGSFHTEPEPVIESTKVEEREIPETSSPLAAPTPVKVDMITESTTLTIRRKPGRKQKEKVWKSATPGKRGRKSLKEIAAEADLVEIPPDEELFSKQYYSIGDVANMFRMNPSLIRTWSNEFESMLKPRKNRKGDRFYRPEDVKFLHLIYHLVRVRKFTLEGAKEHLKGQKKKMETQFQVIQKLQQIKAFLLELKANL